MNLKVRSIVAMAICLALLIFPIRAYATEEPAWQDRLQGWYDSAKDKAGELVEAGKEKAPAIVDKGKEVAGAAADKAGELYAAGKEQLPGLVEDAKDGICGAKDAISDWNQGQQEEFWQRIEEIQSSKTAPAQSAEPDATTTAPQPSGSNDKSPAASIIEAYENQDVYYYNPEGDTNGDVVDSSSASADAATSGGTDPNTQTPTQDAESSPVWKMCVTYMICIVVVTLVVIAFLRLCDAPRRAEAEARRREDEWQEFQERRRRWHDD